MTTSEVGIVKAWHEVLNDGDIDRLVALSHLAVEVGSPRGIGRSVQLLCEWVGFGGLRLEPQRLLQQADAVAVEQKAQWRSADTGQVTGSRTMASVFSVRDHWVVRVVATLTSPTPCTR